MNRFYTLIAVAAVGFAASAAEVTDVISASTMTITEEYVETEVSFNTDAVYLVTLKDNGSGPQFKAGTSGIVTKATGGFVKRVEVSWGSKSNEDILVYGQNTPYSASNTVIEGTLLGTIEFTAGATTALDVEGDWEYIGITTTNNKGKAAQFGSISITWDTPETRPVEPCDGVIINEVCGDDGTSGGAEDWIELYNPTEDTLDLSGVKVVKIDEDGVFSDLCTIAEGVTLAPGAYYVVEKGTHFAAGLSNNKNLTIMLYSPLDFRLDMFDKVSSMGHNASHAAGGSYSLTTEQKWAMTYTATKGAENTFVDTLTPVYKTFVPVTASTLTDGMEVVFANLEYGMLMSYNWDKTKDGGIYLMATGIGNGENAEGKVTLDVANTPVARVQLIDGGDGTWALQFIETNNYLNDSRFMACKAFKNIDFKKNDDPTKGTRCSIAFNEGGDAEISYGDGGVIKFNNKGETDSRFFNYDPADKPDEHLAVYILTEDQGSGIVNVAASAGQSTVYYNLQGVKVDRPNAGIYVRVSGGKADKVVIR